MRGLTPRIRHQSRHISVDLLPFLMMVCVLPALGQDPAPPAISPPPTTQPPEAEAPGAIQGTVASGATGQTLRRAQVVLHPADSKGASLYQTTDDSGTF